MVFDIRDSLLKRYLLTDRGGQTQQKKIIPLRTSRLQNSSAVCLQLRRFLKNIVGRGTYLSSTDDCYNTDTDFMKILK